MLLTEMRELNFAQLVSVESRIRRELATFVGAPDFRRFTVRLHVHTSARRADRAAAARSRYARVHDVLKRTLDVIGSVSLLTVLSPLLLAHRRGRQADVQGPGPVSPGARRPGR